MKETKIVPAGEENQKPINYRTNIALDRPLPSRIQEILVDLECPDRYATYNLRFEKEEKTNAYISMDEPAFFYSPIEPNKDNSVVLCNFYRGSGSIELELTIRYSVHGLDKQQPRHRKMVKKFIAYVGEDLNEYTANKGTKQLTV